MNLIPAVASYALQGQAVNIPNAPAEGEVVRMTVGEERTFIGVGETDAEGMLKPRRLVRTHDQQ